MGRLPVFILLVAFVAACQSTARPAASPTPTPSPSPHTAVADAVLQVGDIPTGLNLCAGSGAFDAYITILQASQPALASSLNDEWQSLRTLGAVSAAISLYTSDNSACTAELASVAKPKSAAGSRCSATRGRPIAPGSQECSGSCRPRRANFRPD